LTHIKARWALFQQISADTKDLDDITVGLQLCQGAREANFASELA
jgi:hypothetical protein